VRVINFSIGDRWRPFEGLMSPQARLLDWLAYEHNVVFVVSAGNHTSPLAFECTEAEFHGLTPEEREVAAVRAIAQGVGQRRLLAPAEAVNALTVGALHSDLATYVTRDGVYDFIASNPFPSPISALGPGFRRAVKPDILMPGGRQLYRREHVDGGGGLELAAVMAMSAPGHRAAAPGGVPGDPGATRYARGTSNAAALTTRAAARLYEQLEELRASPEGADLGEEYTTVSLKALLAHGASWGGDGWRVRVGAWGGRRRGESTRTCNAILGLWGSGRRTARGLHRSAGDDDCMQHDRGRRGAHPRDPAAA
jgi:hypothetical protein